MIVNKKKTEYKIEKVPTLEKYKILYRNLWEEPCGFLWLFKKETWGNWIQNEFYYDSKETAEKIRGIAETEGLLAAHYLIINQ